MPYNTRRKSLSLPSLGIHVPVTHASRSAAHRASPSNAGASSPSHPSPASSSAQHPNKKIKRSHTDESRSPPLSKKHQPSRTEPTPPASPTADHSSLESDAPLAKKIDLEGINDEIVEAVIVQLQSTGNRPHLVKELSAILMQQLRIVQQSANPCAIISSRLATYLKRSCWSALSPCPLAKELETVHPRRTYFYLTTCPHQPLPDPSMSQFISRAIVTPPLSSTNSTSEDAEEERRRELSPSPEVDLSSPEFDDMDDDIPMPSTPIGSFSGRFPRHGGAAARSQRGGSPPLEKDEKEFTQTAEGLQKRKLGSDKPAAETPYHSMELDEGARDDSNLFGGETKMLSAGSLTHMPVIASPAMRPTFTFSVRRDDMDSWAKFDSMLEWDRSPENVELEELDGLLNGF